MLLVVGCSCFCTACMLVSEVESYLYILMIGSLHWKNIS